MAKIWTMLATMALLAGCTPVVVAGAGAVVVDEVMEQDGDDGLF